MSDAAVSDHSNAPDPSRTSWVAPVAIVGTASVARFDDVCLTDFRHGIRNRLIDRAGNSPKGR
jgi:hypothetical protein